MKPGGIDPFLDRIERAMDVMTRRQQLVAANIANIDTPGYRTSDVDFKTALHDAVQAEPAGSGSTHTAAAARHVKGLALRNDGNDVNIDREMLNMADTRQRFDTTTSIARFRIKQLLSAIEDGKG